MNIQDKYEQLFYQSLRIRLVEEEIIKIYPTDKIQSPVHLSIGQEAVAVGVCANLTNDDLLYSSYRSHAYYLAKGGDMNEMFAELYGKQTGCGKGKAGSMHLAAKEVGMMGSSAIVGSTISHGVGSAMASKLLGKDQVIITTFGDGATEEGSYHESLNFASVFQVPVIFICENNGLAIHSKEHQRHSYKIAEHAAAYNMKTVRIPEGYDFMRVEAMMQGLIEETRASKKPCLVEIETYRYKEHVGINDDHHESYRSAEVYQNWMKNDPLLHNEELTAKFTPGILAEIEAAVKFAEESPLPTQEELLTDIY